MAAAAVVRSTGAGQRLVNQTRSRCANDPTSAASKSVGVPSSVCSSASVASTAGAAR